jgi:hypothetical protein
MFQTESNKLASARAASGRPVQRVHLNGHSHISETYAVGTADRALPRPCSTSAHRERKERNLAGSSRLAIEQDFKDAIATAIGFFAGSREPFALLWLDVMHRRFEIPQFADALALRSSARGAAARVAASARVSAMADRDNPLRLEDMDAARIPPTVSSCVRSTAIGSGYRRRSSLTCSIRRRTRAATI